MVTPSALSLSATPSALSEMARSALTSGSVVVVLLLVVDTEVLVVLSEVLVVESEVEVDWLVDVD